MAFVKVVGVVRSTTFLLTALCTFIQLFGVFPFQTGLVGLTVVAQRRRDVETQGAPARVSGYAAPPPSASGLAWSGGRTLQGALGPVPAACRAHTRRPAARIASTGPSAASPSAETSIVKISTTFVILA
jgi:hypothetical protein